MLLFMSGILSGVALGIVAASFQGGDPFVRFALRLRLLLAQGAIAAPSLSRQAAARIEQAGQRAFVSRVKDGTAILCDTCGAPVRDSNAHFCGKCGKQLTRGNVVHSTITGTSAD